MAQNEVISLREYLLSIPNSAVMFVLKDYVGNVVDSQVVPTPSIQVKSSNTLGAKFIVDELLTTKMVPGLYKLFAYIVYPREHATEPYGVKDYIIDKVLTQAGIDIKVNGGLEMPSVGV